MHTNPLTINPEDRILVIAPHPDDESIGVGGLIVTFHNQVDVIVMTDGRYGNKQYDPSVMKCLRRKEFEKAMSVAKTSSFKFIDVEDGTLIFRKEAFDSIDVREYTHIFLPNPNDNHSDHAACYDYMMEKIQRNNVTCEVYIYEVHTPLADVNVYLDISDVFLEKIEMIAAHASQMQVHNYLKQVEFLALYRGEQNEQHEKKLESYHKINVSKANRYELGIEIEAAKYKCFSKILSDWIRKESNKSVVGEYLYSNNWDKIAIYGYGVLGKVLYDCLSNSKCHVEYIVDKNISAGLDICTYSSVDSLPEVDLIIVTSIFSYAEIEQEINKKTHIPCISIEKLMEEIKNG